MATSALAFFTGHVPQMQKLYSFFVLAVILLHTLLLQVMARSFGRASSGVTSAI